MSTIPAVIIFEYKTEQFPLWLYTTTKKDNKKD